MTNIERYQNHDGTIIVSRVSTCRKVAKCALHYFLNGKKDIDFFYIGASAGQQAAKSMGLFRYMLEGYSDNKLTVYFQPNRVQTFVEDDQRWTDAIAWRAVVVTSDDIKGIAWNDVKENDSR